MRETGARPSRGFIHRIIGVGTLSGLRPNQRRVEVAIAKFYTIHLMAFALPLVDEADHFSAPRSRLSGIVSNRWIVRGAPTSSAQRRRLGSAKISPTDLAALRIVRCDQLGAAPSANRTCELPAEIISVADARIHAEATGRYVLMGRIAGEKNPAGSVALRNDQHRGPIAHAQDFGGDRAPHDFIDQRLRIHRRLGQCVDRVVPEIVLSHEDGAARAENVVVPGRAQRMPAQKIVAAEEYLDE